MQPIALQIKVGNKIKVVGKLIQIPKNSVLPQLSGYWALYREVLWKDLVSHKLKCIGVDSSVWEYCNEQGCGGMVCYCKDSRKIVTVSAKIINECRSVDIGELPQKRIPMSKCKIYADKQNIATPWVAKTHTVEPKIGWEEPDNQPEMF